MGLLQCRYLLLLLGQHVLLLLFDCLHHLLLHLRHLLSHDLKLVFKLLMSELNVIDLHLEGPPERVLAVLQTALQFVQVLRVSFLQLGSGQLDCLVPLGKQSGLLLLESLLGVEMPLLH